jgi:hypothetical protein
MRTGQSSDRPVLPAKPCLATPNCATPGLAMCPKPSGNGVPFDSRAESYDRVPMPGRSRRSARVTSTRSPLPSWLRLRVRTAVPKTLREEELGGHATGPTRRPPSGRLILGAALTAHMTARAAHAPLRLRASRHALACGPYVDEVLSSRAFSCPRRLEWAAPNQDHRTPGCARQHWGLRKGKTLAYVPVELGTYAAPCRRVPGIRSRSSFARCYALRRLNSSRQPPSWQRTSSPVHKEPRPGSQERHAVIPWF